MEILSGIYRIKNADIVKEKHGGTTINHEVYWYLCFYPGIKIIGIYGTSVKDSVKWYFKKEFDQTGQIEYCSGNFVKLYIQKSHLSERLIFEGEILEKRLRLKAFYENTPDEIWLEDEFEYLDLDYEKLKKEFEN